ncbi:MAG: DNA-3-methyladenine glycosylase family protein [Pyrinomonadaceae bacterium]
MMTRTTVSIPADFSFRHTVGSHGWYDLPPFELDRDTWTLRYVFARRGRRGPVSSAARVAGGTRLTISHTGGPEDSRSVAGGLRHILRLDEPLETFYEMVAGHDRLGWAAEAGAGRLLRSATVFEDLVKTICTTNCSWALTKKMTSALVENLGEPAADGRRAFPTPEAMASVDAGFYRDEIRAGYRSPYFVELAEKVAAGELDPESWLNKDVPSAELRREIKSVKGVGDYAADNLLKLLGRYDGLALDSWLRSQFYKRHNRGKQCPDKKIERFYAPFGDWKGLAIWCDMTEHWF